MNSADETRMISSFWNVLAKNQVETYFGLRGLSPGARAGVFAGVYAAIRALHRRWVESRQHDYSGFSRHCPPLRPKRASGPSNQRWLLSGHARRLRGRQGRIQRRWGDNRLRKALATLDL